MRALGRSPFAVLKTIYHLQKSGFLKVETLKEREKKKKRDKTVPATSAISSEAIDTSVKPS